MIDDVIYLYFLGEMIIKMIAMGVMGRGCYLQVLHFVISTIIACHYILSKVSFMILDLKFNKLQETWNKLDCFIVISG